MTINFYIPLNKLGETKTFIRNELSSAKFDHDPIKVNDKWNLSVTLLFDDGNKLSEFLKRYYHEKEGGDCLLYKRKFPRGPLLQLGLFKALFKKKK